MKKKVFVGLFLLGIIMFIAGISILFDSKKINNKSNIVIIDATYMCSNSIEEFYEDDKYVYSFPCVKSQSIFVKFENENKMLVVDALEEKKVTIDELINAGLEVYKKEK